MTTTRWSSLTLPRRAPRGARGCRSRVATAALLLSAVLAVRGQPVWGAGKCAGCVGTLRQVTSFTQGDLSTLGVSSQLADFVTFTSNADVEGPGTAPGHREVYLYDVANDTVSRLTTTAGGESYDATRLGDEGDRGRYLAFISTGDLDPTVGNADANPELFFWDLSSGGIFQITNTQPPVVNAEPFISDSGKCVTLHSNGDIHSNDGSDPAAPDSGFSNPDGGVEAFIYEIKDNEDLRAGHFTQMSNGPAGTTSSHTTVGGYIFPRQCGTAAFQSDHDQLGIGAPGTNVYIFDRSTATLEPGMPMPGDPGLSINPSATAASRVARGPFVVLQSNVDILGNGSSGFEIFRYRALHPKFAQYTFSPTGASENPVMSDGGGFLAFQSTAELLDPDPRKNPGTPYNADGNREIFLMKGRRKVQQITQSTGCENTIPSIHGYLGRVIAFRSTCDLVPGHNPGGLPQLFLYSDVERDDTITLAACTLANGCCQEGGCYTRVYGAMRDVPRPRHSRLPQFP